MAETTITPEEAASFRFGGTRARPRKGIEAVFKVGETYLKPPGSCRGRWPKQGISVEVECCRDCTIYVLDPCDQVQIADCINCRVVVGPCTGSLFLLDCTGCTFAVAGKQIRLRDVRDSELRVYAPTHECTVLEASSGIRIGAWDVAYPGLADQFAAAGWAPNGTNFWNTVYDFSPADDGSKHFTLLEADGAGRWCELKVAAEGLCGGTVDEVRAAAPTTAGCECPSAAGDGVFYDAPWFPAGALAAAATMVAKAKAGDAAAAASISEVQLELRDDASAAKKPALAGAAAPAGASCSDGFVKRALGWLGGLFGLGPKKAAPAEPEKAAPAGQTSTTCVLQ